MNRMIVNSRVGPDGVLHVTVPVGINDANRKVQVIIEPSGAPGMTQEQWRAWVESTAGSVTDPTFRRHDQGEYEEREPLDAPA